MEQIENMLRLNNFEVVVLFDHLNARHKPTTVMRGFILQLRYIRILRRQIMGLQYLIIPVHDPSRGLCFATAFTGSPQGVPLSGEKADAVLALYPYGQATLLYTAFPRISTALPSPSDALQATPVLENVQLTHIPR